MRDRERLIQSTPRLLEAFRDARYKAGFIIVDRDDAACPTAVIDDFDEAVRDEARKPIATRFLFVCVAVRTLESWLLADAAAINAVLPTARYSAPRETGDASGKLGQLWRQQYPRTAFNKIDFAKRIAPKFTPGDAARHSASFKLFWERVADRAR